MTLPAIPQVTVSANLTMQLEVLKLIKFINL
jgi:hypothetical protein